MKASALNQKWNTRYHSNRLKFALVVDEANSLRSSVIVLLREHGWLVHGVSRAEQAFCILPHIPYSLIVIDSELPGTCAMDFVRILRNSKAWQTIRLVVIHSSESGNLESQLAEAGGLLARRSMWQEDLRAFLLADEEDSRTRVADQTPVLLRSGANESDPL